jgi:hypothetical protein
MGDGTSTGIGSTSRSSGGPEVRARNAVGEKWTSFARSGETTDFSVTTMGEGAGGKIGQITANIELGPVYTEEPDKTMVTNSVPKSFDLEVAIAGVKKIYTFVDGDEAIKDAAKGMALDVVEKKTKNAVKFRVYEKAVKNIVETGYKDPPITKDMREAAVKEAAVKMARVGRWFTKASLTATIADGTANAINEHNAGDKGRAACTATFTAASIATTLVTGAIASTGVGLVVGVGTMVLFSYLKKKAIPFFDNVKQMHRNNKQTVEYVRLGDIAFLDGREEKARRWYEMAGLKHEYPYGPTIPDPDLLDKYLNRCLLEKKRNAPYLCRWIKYAIAASYSRNSIAYESNMRQARCKPYPKCVYRCPRPDEIWPDI